MNEAMDGVPVFFVVVNGKPVSKMYRRSRAAERVRDAHNSAANWDKSQRAFVHVYRLKFDGVYASGQSLVDGEWRDKTLNW